MALKTSLTVEEVYKTAYLHHVLGVEQHALSIAYSVNAGRIAEACIAMEYAASNVRSVYHQAKQNNHSDFPRLIEDVPEDEAAA